MHSITSISRCWLGADTLAVSASARPVHRRRSAAARRDSAQGRKSPAWRPLTVASTGVDYIPATASEAAFCRPDNLRNNRLWTTNSLLLYSFAFPDHTVGCNRRTRRQHLPPLIRLYI